MVLSIKTTAKCQNRCSFCPVVHWMDAKKGWETSLQNIKDLIKYSKFSDYTFKRIIFSGGEPLLWKHLLVAAKLIRESGITVDTVAYTNALAVNKDNMAWFKSICDAIDGIRISKYENNHENIDLILKENIHNVKIVDRPEYYEVSDKPIPKSLPADCGCPAFGMVGDTITLCSFQDHMIYYQGWNPEDFRDQETKLAEYYLDKFEELNPFTRKMCAFCYGNYKTRKHLKKYNQKGGLK
ncbi:MAG: radical SAM protein [Nanoarchaeota archaeon]|nr:radical SAM protein [Nanoarchaeota archaeon]